MKSKILTFITIGIFSFAFSQSKLPGKLTGISRDMVFVPGGTIQLKSDTITVAAFYLTKEVTNKEYKEFIKDIKLYPSNQLSIRTLKKFTNGEIKDSTAITQYSEIENSIIDSTQFPFDDYFTNVKYDDYPVVGVSDKHATYYAAWKSRRKSDGTKKSKPYHSHYNYPSISQRSYITSNSLENKSRKRILLDKTSMGDFKGFYLIIHAPQVISKTSKIKS